MNEIKIPTTMSAIRFVQKNEALLQDVDVPEAKKNQVLVQVRASGICHTDIEILKGNYGTSAFALTPGHEYAGVVVQIGENVTKFAIGDHVVVDPNIECGECALCKKGLTNLCVRLEAYGVTQDGGFAQYCLVDEGALVRFDGLDFEIAALAEPMACVLNGISVLEIENMNSALVFGAGPIGLLMALALRAKGIKRVIVAELDLERIALVEKLGFEAVKSDPQTLAQFEHQLDLIVDATGVPKLVETLPKYAMNGGTILLFGVCPPDAKIEVSPFEIFRRQLKIVGAHSLNHNIKEALDVIEQIGEPIKTVISHRLSFDDALPYFMGKKDEGSLKIQVQLDGDRST